MPRVVLSMLLASLVSATSSCASSPSGECAAGSAGCVCGAGSSCEDGASCNAATNVCEPPRTVTLPAIDGAARSCEILIEDRGANVVGAEFASSVRGETIRQAPRTAVTFYAEDDAPIARSAVRIKLVGDGDMSIARARCFDDRGHPIAGGGLATGG